MVWKKFCFFRQSPLRPPETHTRTPLTDGVWPSGKATVFGTEDRRFESYHPSQYFPAIDVRATEPRLAPNRPRFCPSGFGSSRWCSAGVFILTPEAPVISSSGWCGLPLPMYGRDGIAVLVSRIRHGLRTIAVGSLPHLPVSQAHL